MDTLCGEDLCDRLSVPTAPSGSNGGPAVTLVATTAAYRELSGLQADLNHWVPACAPLPESLEPDALQTRLEQSAAVRMRKVMEDAASTGLAGPEMAQLLAATALDVTAVSNVWDVLARRIVRDHGLLVEEVIADGDCAIASWFVSQGQPCPGPEERLFFRQTLAAAMSSVANDPNWQLAYAALEPPSRQLRQGQMSSTRPRSATWSQMERRSRDQRLLAPGMPVTSRTCAPTLTT